MKRSPKKGFTLIEIVIVLAIAALIMVIVFLAVAGAQRSQRDTTARNNAARVLAAAEQYAANNSGKYPITIPGPTPPAQTNEFSTNTYLKGIDATITSKPVGSAVPMPSSAPVGDLYYETSVTCSNGALTATGGDKKIAVVYYSEVASTSQCIGN